MEPRHVIAFTSTEKAAAELKKRIHTVLEEEGGTTRNPRAPTANEAPAFQRAGHGLAGILGGELPVARRQGVKQRAGR